MTMQDTDAAKDQGSACQRLKGTQAQTAVFSSADGSQTEVGPRSKQKEDRRFSVCEETHGFSCSRRLGLTWPTTNSI